MIGPSVYLMLDDVAVSLLYTLILMLILKSNHKYKNTGTEIIISYFLYFLLENQRNLNSYI